MKNTNFIKGYIHERKILEERKQSIYATISLIERHREGDRSISMERIIEILDGHMDLDPETLSLVGAFHWMRILGKTLRQIGSKI